MGEQLADSSRPARVVGVLVLQGGVKRALQGDAKMKYFQHAGALLTADGSDDELIKFEGVPEGYVINIPE